MNNTNMNIIQQKPQNAKRMLNGEFCKHSKSKVVCGNKYLLFLQPWHW